MGAMKWQVKGLYKLKTAKWHQLVLFSAPHNTKTAISMPNLTMACQSCGDLYTAGCLSREDGAILRSLEHSWISQRSQEQATAKTAWATISTDTCLKCELMCTAIV